MKDDFIAVCSRSFSKNDKLRNELKSIYKNVKFNDKGSGLKGKDLIDFLRGCKKAIVALEVIDDNILSQLPDLKIISKYGVGLDKIDFNSLKKHKIKLGWEGGVNKRSVSELVLGLVIIILRKLTLCNKNVISGNFSQIIGSQLTGKKFGIIGCGNVGKDVIRLLKPFDLDFLVYDIVNYKDFYKKNNVTRVTLDDLLKKSDIISLHVPLDKSTKNILNKNKLNLIKKNALLINTARGGLVDESELKIKLKNNTLKGAAFDVFMNEPPIDKELLNLSNFFATPHIGGSSEEAILAMGRSAINGLDVNEFVQ